MGSKNINGVTYHYDNAESAWAASTHVFDSKGSKIALGIGVLALLAGAIVKTHEIIVEKREAKKMKEKIEIYNNKINKNNKESK